jgi:hypothetical protein
MSALDPANAIIGSFGPSGLISKIGGPDRSAAR